MYIPASFKVDDPDQLACFIQSNSFATLVTSRGDEAPLATHLPLNLKTRSDGSAESLRGHMARANPQWRDFSPEHEILAIFSGPHAYVSPSWYASKPAVPTWNYAVAHVYGLPRVIADTEQLKAVLSETVEVYESQRQSPWTDDLPTDLREQLLQAIVGFEIQITRIEGKFKLGQNRSSEDQQGVYTALSNSPDPIARELANLMRSEGLVD